MTTAHRPTWYPTRGGTDQGGNRAIVPTRQYSSKDLPGHTKIKYRQPGQGAEQDIQDVDFGAELLNKEVKHLKNKLKLPEEEPEEQLTIQHDEEEDSSEEEDSEESDFDEEELKAEIEKIKKEREEQKRQFEEAEKQAARERRDEIIRGNPLLDIAPGYALKRKWTEDTIFRNQASGIPKEKRRFINDTVRSDFHKKFLHKYIH